MRYAPHPPAIRDVPSDLVPVHRESRLFYYPAILPGIRPPFVNPFSLPDLINYYWLYSTQTTGVVLSAIAMLYESS